MKKLLPLINNLLKSIVLLLIFVHLYLRGITFYNYIVVGLTLLYLVFFMIELYFNTKSVINRGLISVPYLTNWSISTKVIKWFLFICFGFIVAIPSYQVLSGILILIICATEIIAFFVRRVKNFYRVTLFENTVVISTEEDEVVFPQSIKEVEFRYDIFYLKTHQNKLVQIDLGSMPAASYLTFKIAFVAWLKANSVPVSNETHELLYG